MKRFSLLLLFLLIISGCSDAAVATDTPAQPQPTEPSNIITLTATPVPTEVFVPTLTHTPEPVVIEPPTEGKWQFYSDTSVFDGTITTTISEAAESVVTGRKQKTFTPQLYIVCRNRELQIIIDVGMDFDVEPDLFGKSTVFFRFDNGEEVVMVASQFMDGESIYLNDPGEFLTMMLKSTQMVFGFTPYRTNPDSTTFDLAGLPQAIAPVLEACK